MAVARLRTTAMVTAIAAVMAPVAGGADERQTVGYVETVLLYPGPVPVTAKIDTGADTSSLGATEIVEFQRDGKPWVRFSLAAADGRVFTIERPIVRMARIRRAGTKIEQRPVVTLDVCLGRHLATTEVNLSGRQKMNYRMLIGRLFLADKFLVDASATDLVKSECPGAPRR